MNKKNTAHKRWSSLLLSLFRRKPEARQAQAFQNFVISPSHTTELPALHALFLLSEKVQQYAGFSKGKNKSETFIISQTKRKKHKRLFKILNFQKYVSWNSKSWGQISFSKFCIQSPQTCLNFLWFLAPYLIWAFSLVYFESVTITAVFCKPFAGETGKFSAQIAAVWMLSFGKHHETWVGGFLSRHRDGDRVRLTWSVFNKKPISSGWC